MRPLALTAALLMAAPAAAQSPPPDPKPRRMLELRDCENWTSAQNVKLSPDGQFLASTLITPGKPSVLVLRELATGRETRIELSAPKPEADAAPPAPGATLEPAPPTPGSALGGGAQGAAGQFSPDSRYYAAPIPATPAEVAASKATGPVLALVETATGKVVARLGRARSFAFAGTGPGVLVYQPERLPDDPAALGAVLGGALGTPSIRPPAGVPLRLRRVATGEETVTEGVTEYLVTKDQAAVVAALNAGQGSVVSIKIDADRPAEPVAAHAGPGRVSRLTFDEPQAQLAFFRAQAPPETGPPPGPRIYTWKRSEPQATEAVGAGPANIPAGWQVAERGGLAFTADGKKLAFSTAPPLPPATPEPKDAPAPPNAPRAPQPPAQPKGARRGQPTPNAAQSRADDKVEMDLWHYKDEAIQPMQKVRAAAERTKTYRAVVALDTNAVRQLATEDRDATPPNHGDWALLAKDKPYRAQLWRSPLPKDYSLLNIRTGEERHLFKESLDRIDYTLGESAVVFDGTHWLAFRCDEPARMVNLTVKLPSCFYQDDFDQPSRRPPYGVRGFTADRKSVVIADKHDLWLLALDGSSASNLTRIGAKSDLSFNVVGLGDDFSAQRLDLSKPLLLSAENLKTRDTGFYRLAPGEAPKLLVMGPRKYGTPVRAKGAETLLLTASTFRDFPDYYTADPDFKTVRRATDIEPRLGQYKLGYAEMVNTKSADGVPLQGMLIKPDDFDPSKKYPMVVYIYEKLSQELHRHRLPTVGTSISPAFYASRGYLVFMPDIVYAAGAPGTSALKCVLPAIQGVVDKGFVDEQNIGIQGHSWGGYQIAYLITQTTRFKCAAAGAPVANMTSAYGGVRWGTGLPRQFQYEQSQSRIGKTLWEAPLKYVENSPLFSADRVTTPLLMLHNDADDAVPWYQGIEYYLALRRLGKEVYLLNYNNELHGLRKRVNQRDYTVRMFQFFEHHLRGQPAPEWMAKGVAYKDRDAEKLAVQKLFGPLTPEPKGPPKNPEAGESAGEFEDD